MAYTHQGELEKAKEHLLLAEEMAGKLWLKYYVSTTLLAKCYILFKEAAQQGEAVKKEKIADLLKTSQQLIKTSKNVYCNKTEAYRFMAMAYVYAKKPGKALKFFKKSIEFSDWYGAKLERSRTYFELGKFLSGTKTKKLKGLSAKDYLEKAKTMFEEMDLQWDLKEYGKFLKKG
jgi:tetratricopeptide (TPR) repeat protein